MGAQAIKASSRPVPSAPKPKPTPRFKLGDRVRGRSGAGAIVLGRGVTYVVCKVAVCKMGARCYYDLRLSRGRIQVHEHVAEADLKLVKTDLVKSTMQKCKAMAR